MIVGFVPLQFQIAAGQMGQNLASGAARQHAGHANGAAPVPQASVMPLPRSQVRMVTSCGECTWTKCTLIRWGKSSRCSSFGPSASSGTVSTSSQYNDQVRIAHRDARHPWIEPAASLTIAQCDQIPAAVIIHDPLARQAWSESSPVPGSARPCRRALACTLPSATSSSSVSTPRPVSIFSDRLRWRCRDRRRTWPRSARRCRTFRLRCRRR